MSDMRPLERRHICLVYHGSLAHYTRLWEEIAVLQDAGARVSLFTTAEQTAIPESLEVTSVRPLAPLPPPSSRTNHALRALDDALRIPIRRLVSAVRSDRVDHPRAILRRLSDDVDLFWAIDYFCLQDVLSATRGRHARILYETFDLVPEYASLPPWRRWVFRSAERRSIRRIHGFITASDSYADYYMERYARAGLARRPVVRSNMPTKIVDAPKLTEASLRLLFMGYLQDDRPVDELITAMSLIDSTATLTLQGVNRLGDAPRQRIETLGLTDRVRILDPCPPTQVVEAAASYDIGIVALRGADENERRAATGKLFTYMSAGLAVLASDLPGIARVVTQYDNGVLVPKMTPRAWASAIDHIASMSRDEVDSMRRSSLAAAREHSWEQERPSFVGEFERAIGASGDETSDEG